MFHVQLGAWDMGLLSNQLCDELSETLSLIYFFLPTCSDIILMIPGHDEEEWVGNAGAAYP